MMTDRTVYVYRETLEDGAKRWDGRKAQRTLVYIREANAYFANRAYERMMERYADDLADLRDTERSALR